MGYDEKDDKRGINKVEFFQLKRLYFAEMYLVKSCLWQNCRRQPLRGAEADLTKFILQNNNRNCAEKTHN